MWDVCVHIEEGGFFAFQNTSAVLYLKLVSKLNHKISQSVNKHQSNVAQLFHFWLPYPAF